MRSVHPWQGDAGGGLVATLILFPRAMALGALVFTPLGPDALPLGVVSGVVALALSNLISARFGSMAVMTGAPFSLSAFMLMGALHLILAQIPGGSGGSAAKPLSIALLLFTVFLSGLFQVLFGLCRIGNLAKYIPYPVLSGLLNGTSVLIILSQLPLMFGMASIPSPGEWGEARANIQGLTLLTGLITCGAILISPKVFTRFPAPLVGILAGTAAYTFFSHVSSASLGPLVGVIPSTLPTPAPLLAIGRAVTATEGVSTDLLFQLSLIALGMAGINSLRSLLVCTTGENLTRERVNGNRELIGQGIGNMASAAFGGISCAGSLSSTIATHRYGGRSPLSRASCGFFALLVLTLLARPVGEIPQVVLAGMLIIIALQSFDLWSLKLLAEARSAISSHDWSPLVNLFTVLLVMTVLLTRGMMEALGAGIILSVTLFLRRMSRSIIRRELTGDQIHSNTLRPADERTLLEREGRRIYILELEGAIFFGTADKVACRVDKLFALEIDTVILDLHRVMEVDTTGADILHQLLQQSAHRKKQLSLCWSAAGDTSRPLRELTDRLRTAGITSAHFEDLESALSQAEDRLLDALLGHERYDQARALAHQEALATLTQNELERLEGYIERSTYKEGEAVFHQGDSGDAVYFILAGRACIVQRMESSSGPLLQTLATLSPGTCFGEMAILDGSPRSTGVEARGTLLCCRLTTTALQALEKNQPAIAFKVLTGFGRDLAKRVRSSNRLKGILMR